MFIQFPEVHTPIQGMEECSDPEYGNDPPEL